MTSGAVRKKVSPYSSFDNLMTKLQVVKSFLVNNFLKKENKAYVLLGDRSMVVCIVELSDTLCLIME